MKRRFLQALLVAVALWPALQFGLTQAYGVNPWKLFGFAMYTVPGPRLDLEIIGITADGRGLLLRRERYSPEERRLAARFVSYRAELGTLASADALAAGVLDGRPELDSVVIGVRRYWIDRESARVVAADDYRRFTRDGRSEPFEPPRS